MDFINTERSANSSLLSVQIALLVALFIAERLIINSAVCALIELVGLSTLITALLGVLRERTKPRPLKFQFRMFELQAMLIALVVMSKCSHYRMIEIIRNLV